MNPSNLRPSAGRFRIYAALIVACSTLVAACVTPSGGGGGGTTTSTSTTSTTIPVDPNAVTGAQLTWAYNQYAHYGVFGAWSQKATGANVSLSQADGQSISGDPVDAGRPFTQVHFDGGTGSIDRTTGAGTITWDTGDWVLNAYNGQFGAPDETLRDPQLTVQPDGSGSLSFEAYIPAALDINGNPAPAAGPLRIAVATFDNLDELTAGGLKTDPDFAGRSYTNAFGQSSLDCAGVGGSWPAAWINFIPASVQAHYFTTSCEGLNLKKPPLPFSVSWTPTAAAITQQPVAPAAPVAASGDLGLKVWATGNPAPTIQWQRTLDGTTWTDVPGALGYKYPVPAQVSDNGASFRAVLANGPGTEVVTDVVGPITVTTSPATISAQPAATVTVGRGAPATVSISVAGAPTPAVQWQRSDDDGATWIDVPTTLVSGAQHQHKIDATVSSDDGAWFRATVTNGIGDPVVLTSSTSVLSVQFNVPAPATQPKSISSFVGQLTEFTASFTALPTPTYQWETSGDGGATWTDWAPTSTDVAINGTGTTLRIPTPDLSLDGDQFRLRATNAAGVAFSNPATLTLVPVTGGLQVLVVPNTPIDRTQPATLQVIGAGFAPPDEVTGNMRFTITDTTRWQPGQNGSITGAVTSATVTRASLVTGGFFRRDVTINANVLNPSLSYGVATFAVTATQRYWDTWTPLTLVTP